MSFQIKDFRSIVASMVNIARATQTRLTDFSVGSVSRTLMESPAAEIEELYLQMLLGLQDAIPVSIYQAFSFDVVDALPASGTVTAHFSPTLAEPFTFPKAMVLQEPLSGRTFYVTSEVTAAAGSTSALLVVSAAVPGTGGNIPADSLQAGGAVTLPTTTTFTHLAFTTGMDAESDLERKSRFVEFILSLSRGTVQAVRFCASTAMVYDGSGAVVEYVTRVGIDESPGIVRIYLYGSSGPASALLLQNAQMMLDGYVEAGTGVKVAGYRSAGVDVSVLPMAERLADITVSVGVLYGVLQDDALKTVISNAIGGVIESTQTGALLRSDAVVNAVLSLSGVLSCFMGNDTNVQCGEFEVLRKGAIAVNWI